MSDPLYDVLKDLVVPGLAGIGGILVGIGATVVAGRSHHLASQVRSDEQRREQDASRERHRDQLFRTVEPAVTALLEHRAEIMRSRKVDTAEERVHGSVSIARLRLVVAVCDPDEMKVLDALVDAFIVASNAKQPEVMVDVLGQIALVLPALLTNGRELDDLIRRARSLAEDEGPAKPIASPS